MRSRKLLLFGVLAVVVGLALFDRPRAPTEVVAAQSGVASTRQRSDALQLPDARTLGKVRGELFGAPPPPPAPKASAPVVAPAPVAPPNPYRFAGKVVRGGEEVVLVSKGELVFPVKAGDTVDGTYKVESVGSDAIEFTYLPLGTRDRIAVASVLDVAPAPPAAAAPAANAVAHGPAQLRWEGPSQVQAGASFTVALRVSTKEALQAAPMQLRFEPTVLEAVHVRPGKFFDDGLFSYRVNPAGSIFVGAVSKPLPPGADAELVVVTFKPLKRGVTAELAMSSLSLQGAAGRTIPHAQVAAFRAAIQ
jgi:cohesin domain-containing protein